jgi:hypothetical protein
VAFDQCRSNTGALAPNPFNSNRKQGIQVLEQLCIAHSEVDKSQWGENSGFVQVLGSAECLVEGCEVQGGVSGVAVGQDAKVRNLTPNLKP